MVFAPDTGHLKLVNIHEISYCNTGQSTLIYINNMSSYDNSNFICELCLSNM